MAEDSKHEDNVKKMCELIKEKSRSRKCQNQ